MAFYICKYTWVTCVLSQINEIITVEWAEMINIAFNWKEFAIQDFYRKLIEMHLCWWKVVINLWYAHNHF